MDAVGMKMKKDGSRFKIVPVIGEKKENPHWKESRG